MPTGAVRCACCRSETASYKYCLMDKIKIKPGNKLLLVMLDGVSSEYFMSFPQHFPRLHAVASQGQLITDLAPERCAASLPGRTSIITGVDAAQHGIYSNKIWDARHGCFRDASPADVRVPSLLRKAKDMGMDVVGAGFGMIRPEDCVLYEPPFWVKDYADRNRKFMPATAGAGESDTNWIAASAVKDDERLAECKNRAGIGGGNISNMPQSAELHGMDQDLRMLTLVRELLKLEVPPEILFTELNFTDAVLHSYGCASERSHAAMMQADTMIAELLDTLDGTGKHDQFHIVITSDHGHHDVERGIFPGRIIEPAAWHGEGGMLLVEKSTALAQECFAAQLAPLGAYPYSGDFLPEDLRDQLLVFAASGYASFESVAPEIRSAQYPPLNKSAYASSHSYTPGTASDNRFAILYGPTIDRALIHGCSIEDFYQRLEKIVFP